jgi:hypothetical protein
MGLSWTQFYLYEMLMAYLQYRKLGLSVDNDPIITNFGLWHNLLLLIHINIVRESQELVLVSCTKTLSMSNIYSDTEWNV